MKWGEVKWSGGLRNRVSINSRRYRDNMQFAACMTVWLITFFHILLFLFCIAVCIVVCFVSFCLILKIMYSYFDEFLSGICILIVIYGPF